MDDFLSILLVMVFYVFVVVTGNQKKKTKNAKQRASRARRAVFERAFENMEAEASQASATQAVNTQETREACEGSRVHLHEVTQQQFHESAEGEDPCHRGGAPAAESSCAEDTFSYDAQEEEHNTLAQDVLRGVMMSEILKRPSERAAIRRNGRSMR